MFEDFRAMIRWAFRQGFLDRNPIDGMEPPARSVEGNRVLDDNEIRTLWLGLPESLARSKQCQVVIKLCLVTAQRVGEVAGIDLSELDLRRRLWSLPATRTKNGLAHTVPLSNLLCRSLKDRSRLCRTKPMPALYFPAATVLFLRSSSLERSCAPTTQALSFPRVVSELHRGHRTICGALLSPRWVSLEFRRSSWVTLSIIPP